MTAGASGVRRAAHVSVATLLAVPMLLAAVGLVCYVALVRDARTETQNATDAAALAAARALATDDFLVADPARTAARVAVARAAAVTLGHLNVAGGERLGFHPNEGNDPDGDIVFGTLDRPLGGTFKAAKPAAATNADKATRADRGDQAGGELGTADRVNAVQVTFRRSPVRGPLGGPTPDRDVLARSVAMLDFAVVGFRPRDGSPVPLVPIGIFTDHVGRADNAWDTHLRAGKDEWRFDAKAKKFVAGADGIPEVAVLVGSGSKKSSDVPGLFLQIGAQDSAETVEQVRSGVTHNQLRGKFGSGLVFAEDNILEVIGSPDCPSEGSFDAALRHRIAAGEPRLWPLFTEVNEEAGLVRLNGWVGARIVSAERHPGGGVMLVLQPAVVCHTAAVTEQRSPAPVYVANNRTVCRVRLAE